MRLSIIFVHLALVLVIAACETQHESDPYELYAMGQDAEIEERYKDAIDKYRASADAGHPPAMVQLADLHRNGGTFRDDQGMVKENHLLDQDNSRAEAWYSRAVDALESEEISPDEQVLLANLYGGGLGVDRDSTRAHALRYDAAEAGNAEAQYILGAKALRDRQKEDALDWLTRAANEDHRQAQYRLARMYRQGDGVSKDNDEYRYWLKRAAENGHADSKRKLHTFTEGEA